MADETEQKMDRNEPKGSKEDIVSSSEAVCKGLRSCSEPSV